VTNIRAQERPTKETYIRDLQKRPTLETYKRDQKKEEPREQMALAAAGYPPPPPTLRAASQTLIPAVCVAAVYLLGGWHVAFLI